MAVEPVIYRISYSVYDKVIRPLPQFYFYVEASNEQQALTRLNNYAEAKSINYRSVAVGHTVAAEDLPQELGPKHKELDLEHCLAKGIVVQRESPPSTAFSAVA